VLGEQLALLYDGGAARSVAINNVEAVASAARGIAIMLIDAAIPVGANAGGRAEQT
jgi:hypothetical protein